MDKFKKLMSFCFIMLAPVILILIFGSINETLKFISGMTFNPYYILLKTPIYMIFGILLMALEIQKHSNINLIANIIGIFILLLMFAYYILYYFNILRDISFFTFPLIYIINSVDISILFGVYLFNIIRIAYLLNKKPVG